MRLKPKIAISLRVVNAISYKESRDALSQDWPKLLESLKITPVYIPNNLSKVDDFLNQFELDGIILSSGDDIGKNVERDKTEIKILNYGIQKKIPILGVCRGLQLINTYFGGSIKKTNNQLHVKQNHSILINNNYIKKFLKSNLITVNSFHNNIILENNLGKNLVSFAISKNDDSIEGVFHKLYPIIGVMWHPERNSDVENKKLLQKIFFEKFFWDKLT